MFFWLFIRGEARSWWLTVSLGFIMAGTLGNLYDRLGLHGLHDKGELVYAVRDFLYFYKIEWPVFNVADCCLVCGAFLLLAQAFLAQPVAAPAPVAAAPEVANAQ